MTEVDFPARVMFWADGQEHDIEEIACRVAGASQCEFKVVIGG